MKVNLPAKVRLGLYVLTLLGTPLVAYLKLRGFITDLEVGLWAAEVTAVSSLAALNTDVKE